MSHPVTLLVTDDLQRSRASVFFRLLLSIPHFVWLALWGSAAAVAVLLNWLVTLVRATPTRALHRFLAGYLRYAVHVGAYVNLLANPYPGFLGRPGYAIDVQVAAPARQRRWTVLLRLVLALPAMLVAFVLAGAYGEVHAGFRFGGLLATVALLGWFAALVRGRMPRGLRDAGAYALSYSAQLTAYLFVLTDRYPNSDPLAALTDLPAREERIRLEVDGDLRRSRLTTFFRVLLAIPHFVWLNLWGIVATVALLPNWIATLLAGRSPEPLHRFLAAYLRYQTHVVAFATLTANPFPGFTGAPGSYPVELVIAPRERQNRWTVLFRFPLAVPALLIWGAYSNLLLAAATLGWFASMARGAMPLGLRNAAALTLRYGQQLNAYLFLVTPAYPYSGPTPMEAAAAQPPPAVPPDLVATPA